MKNPHRSMRLVGFTMECFVTLSWGCVWSLAGILLAASIVGIPLAPLAFAIGSYPFYRVQKRRSRELAQWKHRDRPLYNDEPVPWVM